MDCWYCGQRHELNRDACPAYGKTSTNCGRKNHVASKCKVGTNKKSLHNVDEMDMTNEVFQTGAAHLEESELITFRLERGSYLRFQPDTRAQRNVIPVSLYKKVTRNFKMENVNPIHTPLAVWGGTQPSFVGQVILLKVQTTGWCLDQLNQNQIGDCAAMSTNRTTNNKQSVGTNFSFYI